jgi:hypothetical protein
MRSAEGYMCLGEVLVRVIVRRMFSELPAWTRIKEGTRQFSCAESQARDAGERLLPVVGVESQAIGVGK